MVDGKLGMARPPGFLAKGCTTGLALHMVSPVARKGQTSYLEFVCNFRKPAVESALKAPGISSFVLGPMICAHGHFFKVALLRCNCKTFTCLKCNVQLFLVNFQRCEISLRAFPSPPPPDDFPCVH